MHAVCGYPVKSTLIKDIKAGNYAGWLMITDSNVDRYYPETNDTPKGHLNQSRKMPGPPSLNTLPPRFPKQRHYKDTRYVTYTPECTN